MSKLAEFSKQIDVISNINKNLIALVTEFKEQFTHMCNDFGPNANLTNETNANEESSLLHYFSLSKHFAKSDGFSANSIRNGVVWHPMFFFTLLYLIIFVVVFLVTLMLYCKCTRRLFSCLTCGLCFSRSKISETAKNKNNKQHNENPKNSNKNTNTSVESGEENISEEEKKEMKEKEDSLESGLANHTIATAHETQNENEEEEEEEGEEGKLEEKAPLSNTSDKKKRVTMFLVFNCGLLLAIIMLILYICLVANAGTNKQNTIRSVCDIIQSTEDMLIGTCPLHGGDESTCFTLKDTLLDGISVIRVFEHVIQLFEQQNMLTEAKNIPILQAIEDFYDNLQSLSKNVENNNARVSKDYHHELLLKEHTGTLIDEILKRFGDERKNNTKNVYEIRKKVIKMVDDMDNILKKDAGRVLNSINLSLKHLKTHVSNSNINVSIETNVNTAFNIFRNGFLIELIISIIVITVWCVLLYLYLKREDKKVSTSIISLAAIFSIYFGIISIIQMLFTLFLIIFSMIGSTACVMTNEELKMNVTIQKQISSIPVVEKCLKDTNSPLVDLKYMNSLVESVNVFDVTEITKKADIFFDMQQNTLKLFAEKFNKIRNQIWITKINNTASEGLFQKLKNEKVKAALLITHIFKDNISTPVFYGVDKFLSIANPILLQNNYELCFENVQCDGDANKYNITRRSATTDSKYQTIKGHVTNDQNGGNNGDDLDIVLQILALKARLLHDKIFSVQELDPTVTEKLTIRQYIAPNEKTAENNSYISLYIKKLIEEMKSPVHMNNFKQIINQLVEAKDFSVFVIQKVAKKLHCQVAMVPLKRIKGYVCGNVVHDIAHMTVLCFLVGIFAFFLFFYHLYVWLYFKTNQEREEAE